ncbi:hypothetical protein G6F42_002040 [Rhizopus arrhizus]|nr:hypothetical protein G6F42_002040 [Rhizopus arrhizus]
MSFEQGALDIGSVGCTTVYHDWTPKESPLCRTHAVLSTYFTQDLNFSQSAGSNKQLVWDPWSLVWHRIPFSVPFGSCLVQSQPMAFGVDGQCLAGSFQFCCSPSDGQEDPLYRTGPLFWLSGRLRLPESLLSLFELPRLFQIENANSSPPVFSISTVARLESLRRFGFEWPLWMAPILA